MSGQRLRYAGAIAAMLLSTLFMFIPPLIISVTIDYAIFPDTDGGSGMGLRVIDLLGGAAFVGENLWLPAAAIIAAMTAAGVFLYLRGRWSATAAESIALDLRESLYDRLQHLPCRYHDGAETGDLVQRCTSDVETIRLFLAMQVVDIGRAVTQLATVLPILIVLNGRMALVSMTFVPVIFVFAAVFFAKVKGTFKRMDESEGRMTSMLQENLTGIRVVRAFARQEFENARFGRANGEYRDRWRRLIQLLAWYWPLSDFLCISQIALVLMVGGYFVTTGDLTVGILFAFLSYVMMFLWPLRQMGRVLSELGKALVSLGRVGEILSQEPEADPPEAAGRAAIGEVRGGLSFRKLSFAHAGDVPVLREVSFDVEPGQTLAILGPSGSGKSTLINLLLRLYDYREGSILLDGRELNALPRKYVRSQIGSVLQDPFLYSRTVRENIMLGRTGARDDEMVEAASAACIHDSVTGFEHGYDTLVGERGVTLSGGQRQRVAIARALLRDPPVLILDDALSAVDTETETMILRALKHRRGRRTTLVIAHRLTTLKNADRIAVFEKGRVVQFGTHETLTRAEGIYRRLWRIQSSLETDFDRPAGAAEGDQRPDSETE